MWNKPTWLPLQQLLEWFSFPGVFRVLDMNVMTGKHSPPRQKQSVHLARAVSQPHPSTEDRISGVAPVWRA